MTSSFIIPNYQKNSSLSVDNSQSNLTDFQINALLNISKEPGFHSFVSFDFLKNRKVGPISIKYNKNNKIQKKVFISVDYIGSIQFLNIKPKFDILDKVFVEFSDTNFGNVDTTFESAVIKSCFFDEQIEKYKYVILVNGQEMTVFEHSLSY